jgi:hypothetical protein|tara:strand:- start:965 stop:1486 length:522 start_codon:yes stop_codon:yes gene_type:complete
MKKVITFLVALMTLSSSYSQIDSLFTYELNGLNKEFTIIKCQDLSKKDLYIKTLNWIKTTFRNPDKVIKMKIENENIRIQIFDNSSICGKYGCADELYTIDFQFRDGKIKATPIEIKGVSDNYPINLKDGSLYYKKDKSIKKFYKHVPTGLAKLINKYNSDLYKFIYKKNDDW